MKIKVIDRPKAWKYRCRTPLSVEVYAFMMSFSPNQALEVSWEDESDEASKRIALSTYNVGKEINRTEGRQVVKVRCSRKDKRAVFIPLIDKPLTG